MTRHLSLEDLEGSSSTVIPRPAPLNSHLTALKSRRHALMSLEAVGSFLKLQNPAAVGDCGVRMANLAIEQVCQQAGVELSSLTIDHRLYRQEPAQAMKLGLETLDGSYRRLVTELQDNLLQFMLGQAEKQTQLGHAITRLWQSVADLERRLDTLEALPAEGVEMLEHLEDLLYVEDDDKVIPGLRGACETVVPDLCHFMTEHSHLYKRLVRKQIDWLTDHRDNLLQNADGFAQYVFDPVDYLIHGQTDHGILANQFDNWKPTQGGRAWRSRELPGGMAFWSYTSVQICQGLTAIDVLGKCSGSVGSFDLERRKRLVERIQTQQFLDGQTQQPTRQIPRLDLVNCKARLAEVKRAVAALEHWSEIAYCTLWKDACFEQVIMAELLKAEQNRRSPQVEDGLIALASALTHQLLNASDGVGSYVARTLDTLLVYIDRSIQGGTLKETPQ